ncbi:SusC/RagA family TonB-linked outer membrane protein [Hanamia caeni]|uniref:SusC/RagA family TonB-linked outer membrane protein n=1 Tax=Hanamia caeni TaxID=2294116 RepID=A0A3M9NK93_9BACT|nr:SusC/RagA family TonB-linked outer membrane protein [Hanamia caeni]RNI37885.1 SusC/RagA family TonB-linked outer membrane protein [Hanamia caeni]
MKKLFSLHPIFNAKKDVRFLLSWKFIPLVIFFASIHLPSRSYADDNKGNNKIVHSKTPGFSITNLAPADISDIRVTGIVRDEKGNPMVGVSVLVQGQTAGVSTDNNGAYSLSVQPDAQLRFSFVGYKTVTVAVSGRTHIDVTLTPDASSLDAVVVTALGIKREERSLGYSVAQVSGEELTEVNHENVLTGLSGKVPGVAISSTGGAGSSVSMVIRGTTSLNGDNQPLFVVDGTPIANTLNNVGGFGDRNPVDYGNAISDLNPEDIASVTILKGPSAAALYGSRAGNGVVLITTKDGKKSKGLGISITSSTVFDRPYKYLPLLTSQFGPGERPYTPDNHPTNSLPGNPLVINTGSSAWVGPELDKGYNAVQWNSPLDANGDPVAIPLVSYPDNSKNFMRTGITSTNGIAVANANDKGSYRLSYTNMSNRGILPNTDLYRNALNLATSYRLTKNFTIDADINFVRNNSNNRPAGSRGTNPMDALSYLNPSVNIMDLRDYWMPGQEGVQQKSIAPGDFDNPWFLAYEAINSFSRNRGYGNIKATWQITPEFSVMARYGLDMYSEHRETHIAKSQSRNPNGVFGIDEIFHSERNSDVLATYNKRLSDWDFNVSAGGNIMYQRGTDFQNSTNSGGLVVPGLYNFSNVLPSSLVFSNYSFQKAIYSVYGLASVGYKNMAYVDLTARNDWSSTLPVENRSYFYPSASVSILLNQVLQMPSYVNLFKIRAGAAQVGKDTNPYSLSPVTQNGGAWGDETSLIIPGTLLNPQLKPEIATSYEYGADLAFLNNRLRLKGTIYRSDNKNQILPINLPQSSGYGAKLINAGLVRSEGVELMLGLTPTAASSKLQWDVNINFSKNKTIIEELTEGMDHFVLWKEAKGGAWTYVGQAIGDIYDRKLVTVDDKSSKYYGYPILDEDGSWQDYGGGLTDAVKIGNFNPKFSMGLQTSLSYKGFTLTASFDWRNGGDFISQTYRYTESDLHSQRFLDNTIKYFGPQANLPQYLMDNADKYIKGIHVVGGPTLALGGFEHTEGGITLHDGVFNPGVIEETDADGNFIGYKENLGGPDTKYIRYQDNYPWSFTKAALFDASFIKLREVSLSYAIPNSLSQRIGLQHAVVSVFSRDIILWTKAKIGIDPERAFQPSGTGFEHGVEFNNTLPWVLPIGIKLSLNF